MAKKIKLKKTLYVGLGGTGAETLLRVKKCFIDSYGEIPPMIGFLAIDTDTAAYNKEISSNTGKSIRLEQNELLVCTVKNALPTYNNNPKVYDSFNSFSCFITLSSFVILSALLFEHNFFMLVLLVLILLNY